MSASRKPSIARASAPPSLVIRFRHTLKSKPPKSVMSPGVVTNISTLAAAGYYVDPKQVEEDSGYKITLFQPLQQQPAMPAITSPQAWMSALRTAAAQNPEEFARAIRANNVRQPAPSANQQLVAAAQPHAAKALSQDLTPWPMR